MSNGARSGKEVAAANAGRWWRLRCVIGITLVAAATPMCTPKSDITKEPAGDSGPDKLACPAPLHGPPLALLPAAYGAPYCMDVRETTRAEYDAFVAAKVGTANQPPECGWNTQLTPTLYDPETDDTPPSGPWCDVKDWSGMLPDAAVGCVDFCDAVAFCQWAGKRLCGRVGGSKKWGTIHDAGVTSVGDWDTFVKTIPTSLESEFASACTQGGKTKFGYGDQYQPGLCIDEAWLGGGKSLSVTELDKRQCHGTIPPFVSVYDLSGSVAEWQNLCWMKQESCVVSGTTSASADKPCNEFIGSSGMRDVGRGMGIRCCADAVAEP